jgi:hypothetical protein
MIEGLRLSYLDILSVRVAIEGLRVTADVEISACHVVFVKLDLAGSPHVHEVGTLVERENPLQRFPIRLVYAD